MIATVSIRTISLFLIISLVVVALNYNNNPFNIITDIRYHQTALAIINLQDNNTIKPTNQSAVSNDTIATAGLTVDTDKYVYVAGEYVTVSGKVDKVIEGKKEVRLDFYDPAGKPIGLAYHTAELDEKGFFSYSGNSTPNIPSNAKPGEYTFLVTYNKQGVETKITVK